MSSRQTVLYETHLKYGGKIVEFGGWLLPVQYSGIIEEHNAVRERAGLFDVSHMGEVAVRGPGAQAFLQKVVSNDVSRLEDGQIQYTMMCYENGGTVDDLLIYRYAADDYLLVINAANIQKDWEWLGRHSAGFDVSLSNLSDELAELALQGPLAPAILNRLMDKPLDDLPYYWFEKTVVVAGKTAMVSRTGYTGEDGFEIYCRQQDTVHIWEALMATGKPLGLVPAGLGCRDTLRFEAGMPLYGHELSADISPIEAGLTRFVDLEKGDFIGRNALAAQKSAGPERKLAGFVVTGRGIARAGYQVLADGRVIGVVTTGSYSPTLAKNLGIALVEAGFAKTGQALAVEIRGQQVPAEVIPRQFYKRKG